MKLGPVHHRLYTQQFRHELEVQYGVAEEVTSDKGEAISEVVPVD